MKMEWYVKVTKCPLDEIWYRTPCTLYLKSQWLKCALYCPKKIVDASDDIKKKLAHNLCLTDENNRANYIALALKKEWEWDWLIYPVEYYQKQK